MAGWRVVWSLRLSHTCHRFGWAKRARTRAQPHWVEHTGWSTLGNHTGWNTLGAVLADVEPPFLLADSFANDVTSSMAAGNPIKAPFDQEGLEVAVFGNGCFW